MPWYNLTVTRRNAEGKITLQASFRQLHMESIISGARKGDRDYQDKVAHSAYMRWRRTPKGRRLDDGVKFLYQELQIDDHVPPEDAESPSLFDE
jgi:hypothetical protein